MPFVTRIADAITTWGMELARVHPGATSLGERLVTVFPPVDATEFRPDPERRAAARARLGVGEEDVLIGTVGNRNPTKGHEWLVRAGARLRERHPRVKLRILGAPSPVHEMYERSVRDEAQALGLFEDGALDLVDPGSEVAALMPALDVFAMTSVPRSEGIPTVIFEAMSCGIPVVTTAVGAVREVIDDGVNGWVVPAEDLDAITTALERLAGDAELRSRVGEESRHRVLELYDLEKCAARHLHAYELAVAHRQARR
jgi:glycosyltransferase involved in cell wall biosynthesis